MPEGFVDPTFPDLSGVDEAVVAELMRGAVDLHCHSGPSVMPRQLDHRQAMEDASAAGMRAVLFKDHYYDTSPFAETFRARYPDSVAQPLGAICLNNSAGGFNPFALEPALKQGARIVWMPTVSAANHIREGARKNLLPTKGKMLKQVALTPLDPRGDVIDPVKQILDMIAEYDVIMSAGHLHISEVWTLFDEAKRRGVKRLLVNHPTYTIGATMADITELAGMGVYLEHSICMFIPNRMQCRTSEHLMECIKAASVDKTFFGSDLGQINAPTPVEGFRQIVRVLVALGYSKEDIRKMVSTNAITLSGLNENAAPGAKAA
ncbi:DUF6282 family protein [Muricoccus radiodurans]|uniref:DUF6282 family protein n=1 Tax=Muricoccus radiodurans TaxID=2231721 RepID=UPI003CF1624B